MSVADSKNLRIGMAAIVIAVVSIIIASISLADFEIEIEEEEEEEYRPMTREAFIFTQVDEHIDEEALAIPPDMFSQDTVVVKQGDRVKVHFYNLEPVESQEHHTFTINDPAYKIHSDLNAQENTVIEFTASKSGVFDYICTYHQPTMRGELVVLSK
ncbi:MAG TPA: cupredoxin domain-containing protein [Candidatus Nitrosotenuis sp.]